METKIKKKSKQFSHSISAKSSAQPTKELMNQEIATAVTQHKQVQLGMRKNEATFRALFNTSRDALILHDDKMKLLDCNPAALALSGCRTKEEMARFFSTGFAPLRQPDGQESRIAAHKYITAAFRNGHQFFEWQCQRLDHSTFFAEIVLTRVVLDGKFALQVALRDITQRKQMETALRESENRYRTLVESVNVGIYRNTGGSHGHFLSANQAIARIFGYSTKEFMQLKVSDLYANPSERKKFVDDVMKNGFVKNRKLQLKKKDGTFIWASLSTVAHFDNNGKLEYLDGVIEDITERKRAEDAMQASEAKYRSLVDTTDTGFLILDSNGRVLDANQEYVRITGHKKLSEIRGKCVTKWTAEHAKRQNVQAVAQCVRDGQIRNFITEYIDKKGRITPIEINATVIRDGNTMQIVSLCRDIAERRQAEKSLQESEERFRSLIESAPEAIFVQSEGQFVYVNPGMLQLCGASKPDELLGTHFMDRMAPEYHKAIRDRIRYQRKTSKPAPLMRQEYLRLDGSRIPVETTAVFTRFQGRDSHLVFVRDITERKQLERQILEISEREQQRFGDDLHDGLCQHLSGISFVNTVLQQRLITTAPKEVKRAIQVGELINGAIEDARRLARGLHPVNLEDNGLMSALTEFAINMRAIFGARCQFRCLKPVLITDNLVATHLFRIAQEAVHNAIRHGKATKVVIDLLHDRRGILLKVKDNGSGLPPNINKKGGMGLRIMHYRAAAIGASVSLQNGVKSGVMLTCVLPTTAQ